jgi:pimeloyl-ACP methyl ester carboxylesterase
MPEFKIYDLKYYEDEWEIFEHFFQGEIMIGNLKMTRAKVKCEDRLMKTKYCDEHWTMVTKVVCVDQDPFATIAMVHGWAESSMRSFLETAMHHALNGFEVILADMKGHGYASGVRGAMYTSFDWHNQIGVLLQQCPTDKPLFVQCHSQGC